MSASFLNRPLTGDWPPYPLARRHLSEGAPGRTDRTSRRNNRRGRQTTEGRGREIIGLGIGPSEAETFWTEFLRPLRVAPGGRQTGHQATRNTGPQSRHPPGLRKQPGNAVRVHGCATPWPMFLAWSAYCRRCCHPNRPSINPRPHPCRRNLAQGRRATAPALAKTGRSHGCLATRRAGLQFIPGASNRTKLHEHEPN